MWPQVIAAIITALSSTFILKILEHFLNNRKQDLEIENTQRDQFNKESANLREQITALRDDAKKIESESDHWRAEYWAVIQEYNDFRFKVTMLLIKNGIDPSLLEKAQDKKQAEEK